MSVFRLSLQSLSPIHIGDGNELRQGFDFVTRSNATYRVHEDNLLRDKMSTMRPDARGQYPTPGQLLREEDFQNSDYFRYILRGVPRSAKTDARVRSAIKDIYDRVYIPGSSLKGALRTALAWTAWEEVRPPLDRAAIKHSKFRPAQPLEGKLFGRDPNHDLLRALHVSDLFGPTEPGAGLILVNAQVITKNQPGSPIELESIASEIGFSGSLTIDETLFGGSSPFGQKVNQELQFGQRRRWLDELPARVQRHSRARIVKQAEWFEKAPGCERIAAFYRKLEAVNPGPNAAFVQLGWGTGWDGKTFWTHLQTDARLFAQLLEDFHMLKYRGNSRPGAPFPASRRAAMLVKESIARPAAPFGWALIKLEKETK